MVQIMIAAGARLGRAPSQMRKHRLKFKLSSRLMRGYCSAAVDRSRPTLHQLSAVSSRASPRCHRDIRRRAPSWGQMRSSRALSTTNQIDDNGFPPPPVVFLLGGPGSGKGTQSAMLLEHCSHPEFSSGFDRPQQDELGAMLAKWESKVATRASEGIVLSRPVIHLSIGDLLRKETSTWHESGDSAAPQGRLIQEYIDAGTILPGSVTMALIADNIQRWMSLFSTVNFVSPVVAHANGLAVEAIPATAPMFLVDGFPRNADNVLAFDESVWGPAKAVLSLECSEDELERRLLARGATSGRSDDTIETIRKRFVTFRSETLPVVDMFDRDSGRRAIVLQSAGGIEAVFEKVLPSFLELCRWLEQSEN